ncbi:hypothetical protein [Streptomyces sp. SID12501]|uniref:hypothetical protein n=1 Tax=Streptomyces sp. SID12501 TaxID=2706042 RepID=UPI001943D0DD|nr:hypothetical protein [Streptomyces sp. SID12501]
MERRDRAWAQGQEPGSGSEQAQEVLPVTDREAARGSEPPGAGPEKPAPAAATAVPP